MSAHQEISEHKVFCQALKIGDPAERTAYLDQACRENRQLRYRVETLLMADSKADGFLDSPVSRTTQTGADTPCVTDEDFGSFRLIRRIGSGSMGEVYLVEQKEPYEQIAALKILRSDLVASDMSIRFRREEAFLARMNHPSIPALYQAGETAHGRPYFVMEWIKGVPITQYCSDHELSIRERVELFLKVCRGVQHAHFKGIIHRDLKPENLLVTEIDHSAEPKIIDFGIAKSTVASLGKFPDQTQAHQVVGTLSYMSPEHLSCQGENLNTKSDVYSLGVLLYEILTNEHPYFRELSTADNLSELVQVITDVKPERPSNRLFQQQKPDHQLLSSIRTGKTACKDVRRDLDVIVLKMLEKHPDDRYGTVSQIADDLQCYLDYRPISTCQTPVRVSLKRWCQRNRLVTSLAGVTLVLLTSLTLIATWATRSYQRQQELHQRVSHIRQQLLENQDTQNQGRIARRVTLPTVLQLHHAGDRVQAFGEARKVKHLLQDDLAFQELWNNLSTNISCSNFPKGTRIFAKDFGHPETPWIKLGDVPFVNLEVPQGLVRIKFEHPDCVPRQMVLMLPEGFDEIPPNLLEREPSSIPGMVLISHRKNTKIRSIDNLPVNDDFWIDQYEVTNQEYASFIQAGGYEEEAYWSHLDFIKAENRIPWQQAVGQFVDQTGHYGPASWRNGRYPDDLTECPVDGISWFEAAAYAAYRDKQLPTVDHWRRASYSENPQEWAACSNFTDNLVRVGTRDFIGYFHTYDMFGNVREWCWNQNEQGKNALLGGGVGDADYQFQRPRMSSPWIRKRGNGFRCMKVVNHSEYADLKAKVFNFRRGKIATVKRQSLRELAKWYHYDERLPLNPKLIESDALDGHNDVYRHEVVEIDTSYRESRFKIHICLPRKNRAERTIVYLPGGGRYGSFSEFRLGDAGNIDVELAHRLALEGYMVVFPIYKGTFDRWSGETLFDQFQNNPQLAQADWIHVSQDLFRTVDYLETRNDFTRDQLICMGLSNGSKRAVVTMALDPRFTSGVLLAAGYTNHHRDRPPIHEYQFSIHVRQPILMVTGLHDNLYDYNESQLPLFDDLASEHKKHVLLNANHLPDVDDILKHINSWFDEQL